MVHAIVMYSNYTANESVSVLNVTYTWIVHVYCILQSAKLYCKDFVEGHPNTVFFLDFWLTFPET